MNKLLIMLSFLLCVSCNNSSDVFMANGIFIDSQNKQIGTVEIIEQGFGSNFRIHLESLLPGAYAMHIHEKGICDTPEFVSSGGHHGLRADGSFSGDFNPIYVKNDVSKYTGKIKKFNQIIFLEDILLNPDSELTIIDEDGSSIIIHENYNGGRRIACAKIIYSN